MSTAVKYRKKYCTVSSLVHTAHTDHDLAGIICTQLSPRCVRVSGGIREVEGGMVVALLKCFPTHHSVKRSAAPEADCHPAYRRRASLPLIDSGRGHSLTLSLHIKGLLREGGLPMGIYHII